jgi:hypothetical protein
LINAMLAAAVATVTLLEAIAQNGPFIDDEAASATANAATLTATPLA